ncbi:uncharacterized protein LOC126761210 [Bactrocera neohumeralis]|uniref:uncharacterized protein LOC126761210 n=1 Tax=Bactrocera neohumeralis TaxID=98809 RepID=UPI002165C016|nr:uncharacterized protein LOC126761210 [Bactrocera neohumeralis]
MFKLKSESYVLTVVLLLLFSKSSNIAFAVCNACSISNFACTSQTQFQVCVEGLPTGTPLSCPSGYICSTTAANICVPSDNTSVDGDCTECYICDASQTFACTGVRTFALCLGTKAVSNIGGNCAPYLVCSIDYPHICGDETMIAPTCPTADELATTVDSPTTTTTSGSVIVTNPVAFCQTIQQNGRFPVGNELKTNCQQYVYCFINGNVWSGAIYYCPSDTYFDTSSRYCSPVVPARCVSSAQLLYLGTSESSFDDVQGME